jgi:short-subunit dehydrogenase
MRRSVSNSVVVITGASCGIGRATALEIARQKGTVILASRQAEALKYLEQECEHLGARTLVVPTDVTNEEAVMNLARQAIETFGRIDVWVNNAAVSLFARFEDAPADAFRRVIETNFFGYVHGARAVLPYFREQGRGILINLASMNGKFAAPYTSAYIATKFAIVGLSESLRMELQDAPEIRVCTILPASIDTPLFQHAANFTGRAVKPLEPIYAPEKVARAIVQCIQRPTREVFVGNAGRQMGLMHRFAPGMAEKMNARLVETNHFQDRAEKPSSGNLFEPMPQYNGISGGWKNGHGTGKTAIAALGATLLGAAAAIYYLFGDHKTPAPKRLLKSSRKAATRLRKQAASLVGV